MPRVASEETVGAVPWGGGAVYDTPEPEALGVQLKGLFDQLSEGPMPSRLVDLADALEAAFQRGELYAPCAKDRPARR
ncbi:hypothetical protein BH09PSE2_BH09PSE2_19030 [soil metagenome]